MSIEHLPDDEPDLLGEAPGTNIPVALLEAASGQTIALLLPRDKQTGELRASYTVVYSESGINHSIPRVFVREALGGGNEEVGLARLCDEIQALSFDSAERTPGAIDPIWDEIILAQFGGDSSRYLEWERMVAAQSAEPSPSVYDVYREFLGQSRQTLDEY